jgi:hypothetical protein
MSNIRKVRESTKKLIVGAQSQKCNNSPGSNLKRLEKYKCPMWIFNEGIFDEGSYEIDHIVEWSISKNDDINNLQALCPNCHRVKTRKFCADKRKDDKNLPIIMNDDDIDKIKKNNIKNTIIVEEKNELIDECLDEKNIKNTVIIKENKVVEIPMVENNEMTTNYQKFICDFCHTNRSSKRNLHKHYVICKEKAKKDTENKIYNEMDGNIEKEKKDIEEEKKNIEKEKKDIEEEKKNIEIKKKKKILRKRKKMLKKKKKISRKRKKILKKKKKISMKRIKILKNKKSY